MSNRDFEREGVSYVLSSSQQLLELISSVSNRTGEISWGACKTPLLKLFSCCLSEEVAASGGTNCNLEAS